MHTLRSRLALVLLLCFTRVLLPEAWILRLHQHQHTTEEPTLAPGALHGKAVFSAEHQHCGVDHFYDVPFQPTVPLEWQALRLQAYQRRVAAALIRAGKTAPPASEHLRGPPVRS